MIQLEAHPSSLNELISLAALCSVRFSDVSDFLHRAATYEVSSVTKNQVVLTFLRAPLRC